MSIINSQPLIGASGNQGGAYNIERSLRFRSSASAWLSRTPASTTNQQKYTLSTWVKRGQLGAYQDILDSYVSTNNIELIRFFNDDTFELELFQGSFTYQLKTTQVFRDPSAWYHIVVAYDTTQATASNRIKVYVNGVQVTSFSTSTYPSQNANLFINRNVAHSIGVNLNNGNNSYFDGYLAEFNFIDGQQLDASSFGETDTATGVWKPKKYTGTYGTNGYYLKFDNLTSTSTLGNDSSGNGNNWTVNNISLTSGATYDSMTDVPTLTSATAANYCVINSAHPPVVSSGGTYSITNANLSANAAGSAKWMSTVGTFQIPVGSGKWYFEFVPQQNGADYSYGVGMFNVNNANLTNAVFFDQSGGLGYSSSGQKVTGGTYTSYGASWGVNGDIIGVAIDASGATTSIEFYKNNTSQGVAFSGLTGTYVPAFGDAGANAPFSVNFGQRPFSYTPPSGFVALNTFNLPTPTIGATASTQTNKYFDISLWSGNAVDGRSITNTNTMQPDLVWIKSRNSSDWWNILFDSVRGAGNQLASNVTDAELASASNVAGKVSAFNSDGFTVAKGSSGILGGLGSVNGTGITYVGWQWRASGSTVSNTSGTITSTVSANTSAGFSIVTYTGTGGSRTVGHGLGVAPNFIIVKERSPNTDNWNVYHSSLGASAWIQLNLSNAATTGSSDMWNGTAPTSTVFSVNNPGIGGYSNRSGSSYVAYCFAEVAGYSRFGSYTGNGSTDGVFIYTGFRPRYIIFKRTDSAAGWLILDSARNTFNVMNNQLYANAADAESGGATADFLSNGVKIRETGGGTNANGGTYVFAAFAENPFKYSLAR